MNYIAGGDAKPAYGLLCKRTAFAPWLIHKVVRTAVEARAQAQEATA
jgi:hypothetical protein